MTNPNRRLPPSKWPEGWLSTILSVIATLPGKYRYASQADYWRAYVLVSRDTNWPLGPMMAMRFDQIAPDGTVVFRRAGHPVPLVAKLSKETLYAVKPLRESPHPSGRVFVPGCNLQNFQARWQRIIKAAGFNKNDSQVPRTNAPPNRRLIASPPPKPQEGEPQTLMQFLDHTYAPLRLGSRSPRTLLLYRISIRSFGRFLEREAMTSDLTDQTVSGYMAHLREKNLSPHTVLKEYAQLIAIWRFACQRRVVNDYPTVEKPKAPRTDPKSWLQSDIDKLFKAIGELDGWIEGVRESEWWLALHYVIWNSGERISAVLNLQWSDIDLAGKWVTIKASYRKGHGEDKTHALADYTIEALRKIQHPPREFVFNWPHHHTYIWQVYGRILKSAGLPANRLSKFHRMRRTVATQFELRGGDATKLLGHFDRSVTEGHYLDPRVIKRQQAIDLLPRPESKPALPPRSKRKAGGLIEASKPPEQLEEVAPELAWLCGNEPSPPAPGLLSVGSHQLPASAAFFVKDQSWRSTKTSSPA